MSLLSIKNLTVRFGADQVVENVSLSLSAGKVLGVVGESGSGKSITALAAIGLLTLALFAFLAAVYLTLETDDPALQEDFRRRALGAAVAVGLFALLSFFFSAEGAPLIRQGLAEAWWSLPFQLLTGVVATSVLWAVWGRYYQVARILTMIQVTMILWGWGLAQFPYIVEPDLTFSNTATSDNVMRPLLIALAAGAVLLVPSLWYLFRVFKGQQGEE